jgi:hypothetical protein
MSNKYAASAKRGSKEVLETAVMVLNYIADNSNSL